MQIIYRPTAEKQIRKIPKNDLKTIIRKIEQLSLKPKSGKPLMGEYRGQFSLRAWPYRIIYSIQKNTLVIFSVAHRQSAYRK